MRMTVISPGLLTTVQDGGRKGYQASGFSVSGCMDREALLEANLLVNNPPEEAVLEMQYMGGSFSFDCDTNIALTGADLQAELNGSAMVPCRAYRIRPGDVLACHTAVEGRFAYLAVAGGFRLPEVLGSKSTNLKCRMGGLEGRALAAGDSIGLVRETRDLLNGYLKELPRSRYGGHVELRTVAGPQEAKFTEAGIRTFYGSRYTVAAESDRMGYRLAGAEIESVSGVDIISDGIAPGAVQVTPRGLPMVLLADRQTVGGYAKIGTVISTDIPRLVQCMPGAQVSFRRITVEEARALYIRSRRQQRKKMRRTGYLPGNMTIRERIRQRKQGADSL